MFCRQSMVCWCLKFIPISCMWPMHAPKTQIWFFNQFICTGACACSSDLNYAHKMPRKPSYVKNVQTNFYHGMLMPLHDSMPSFMNFRRVLDLVEFQNQASQCFAGNQRCSSVWNSFPFLAWDLSMHPRTQIWFFNEFICTGACACS